MGANPPPGRCEPASPMGANPPLRWVQTHLWVGANPPLRWVRTRLFGSVPTRLSDGCELVVRSKIFQNSSSNFKIQSSNLSGFHEISSGGQH
eukprot:452031-Prorocentrum_minimum.AAC.1